MIDKDRMVDPKTELIKGISIRKKSSALNTKNSNVPGSDDLGIHL